MTGSDPLQTSRARDSSTKLNSFEQTRQVRSLPITPDDIVLMYTGYSAPTSDSDLPETIALSYEAAEYLANIPVRAFGTDAFSVASITDQSPVAADDPVAQTVPAHYALLSRGIPVDEQLVNWSIRSIRNS